MTRAILLASSIAAVICLWLDRPKPSRLVQTDYCVVDYKAAAPDELGEWHIFWTKGYAPCDQQDIYRSI